MVDSESPSVDGADHDDRQDSEQPESAGSKPGRKKNPNNQAARRDQNRIAQREFRLRKQQRIRDLEARVELLSGTKEETHGHFKAMLRGLMDENTQLRRLLRDLGGFLGDGLGGPLLAKTGWDMKQFEEFISKADTDTAYEAYANAKRGGDDSPQSSTINIASGSGTTNDSAKKRKRNSLATDITPGTSKSAANPPLSPVGLTNLLPTNHSRGPFATRPPGEAADPLGNLIQTFNTSSAAPYIDMGNPSGGPGRVLPPPRESHSYNTYMPANMFTMNSQSSPPSASPSSVTPPQPPSPWSTTPVNRSTPRHIIENEAKRDEAGKLIGYHLDNFKRSPTYFLPPSLRPTLVQRTIPHDQIIDGIVHPEIRDRMILLKERFDLPECFSLYLRTTVVHSDDVLSHINWEIGEEWMRRYGFLVDESVLNITNRWRRERRDPELTMAEISGEASTPS